jgi:hypothetical protein
MNVLVLIFTNFHALSNNKFQLVIQHYAKRLQYGSAIGQYIKDGNSIQFLACW